MNINNNGFNLNALLNHPNPFEQLQQTVNALPNPNWINALVHQTLQPNIAEILQPLELPNLNFLIVPLPHAALEIDFQNFLIPVEGNDQITDLQGPR